MIELIAAYAVGMFVGIMLGLIGGGGVFLVVPTIFILEQPLYIASAHNTLMVGLAALIGLVPRARKGEVDWPTVVSLGIPVTLGMLIARKWLNGLGDEVLASVGSTDLTVRMIALSAFAIMLLFSFASMMGWVARDLKPQTELRESHPLRYYGILGFCGLLIGVIPGIVGAGGGVLIVPLLVILFGLPMKTVIGSSLAIVTIKSFAGFCLGDLLKPEVRQGLDVTFILSFAATMMVGVALGSLISSRLDGARLKKVFAWLVLGLALFILYDELLG